MKMLPLTFVASFYILNSQFLILSIAVRAALLR